MRGGSLVLGNSIGLGSLGILGGLVVVFALLFLGVLVVGDLEGGLDGWISGETERSEGVDGEYPGSDSISAVSLIIRAGRFAAHAE